ncbi:DUF1565 domain-containing protein [Ancylothrix sp. C2]|nr:DUF1565 domain-containing protein [Ancylothrix sp. D3o]
MSSPKTLILGVCLAVSAGLISYSPAANALQFPTNPSLLAQASNQNVLYVNSNSGDDSGGNGSQSAPFKTITRALGLAAPNSVIVLAPGTYSAQTGETFPIIMKPGVILQGDPASKGRNIQIIGGGGYVSPTVGSQSITILGADEAGLTGLTISNPTGRGYAVWVESTSPVIADNTFTGSTHDGVSVNGNSSPVIRNNQFRQNGANGVTVFGTSSPEISDNIFENTGYGVNIGGNSVPTLTGNRIFRNRSGVIVQNRARPVLRNNYIEGNIQDGIVALGQSQPNLGTATEAGGNVLRNNGQLDINAQKASEMIPAFGNQIMGNRTAGRIDLSGRVSVSPPPVATRPALPLPSAPPANSNNNFPPSRPALPGPRPYEPVSAQTAVDIPVPPPATAAVPQNAAISRPSTLPGFEAPPGGGAGSGGVLPVPSASIPLGSGGAFTPSPAAAGSGSLRYRVIVDVTSDREQGRVRALFPEAFRTFLNGRVVMQAGVFSSRNNAQELIQRLESNGFKARMEELP